MPSLLLQELSREAAKLGERARRLRADEADRLWRRVVATYAREEPAWPVWEKLAFPARRRGADGWRLLAELVADAPCILFLDPRDGDWMLELADGAALLVLLEETSGFEFYVTDEAASYLCCFTHHDSLLAAGRAAAWLAERAGSAET